MVKYLSSISADEAGMPEWRNLVDAQDLKSCGRNPVPVRPRSPAPYRGVEQLVARRAHNPEVRGSSPLSATIRNPVIVAVTGFLLCFYLLFIFDIFVFYCLFGAYEVFMPRFFCGRLKKISNIDSAGNL